ncbi:MAG: hypothetical protein QNJ78_01295 [Gammaproteobacteria bacterium]|nr:hypothetical protein [Gammaproteobacteria bacterium]
MAIKICFRGDTRTPFAPDNMFANGFSRRMVGAGPIQYRRLGANRAGDIEPSSAVCVSARLGGAAMFPLRFDANDPATSDTYIYVVGLDANALTNTHGMQVQDGLAGVSAGNTAGNALWPLFAHELAIPSIPANRIVAAVKCTRTWNGANWSTGANYQLDTEVFVNYGCTLAAEYLNAAAEFLRNEVSNHRNGATPNRGSGYHPSTPNQI